MYSLDLLKAAARLKNIGDRSSEVVEHTWQNKIPQEFIRMDPWEIEYLYKQAKTAKIAIQEIGRCHGGSTLVFANANTEVDIHSIDIDPTDDVFLRELLNTLKVGKNVKLVTDDSTIYIVDYKYDLLFIDGDHSYDGCYRDLVNWYNNLTVGGSVILHDSYDERVRNAILDFTKDKNVKFVLDAEIENHLTAQHGSLCHFVKLS